MPASSPFSVILSCHNPGSRLDASLESIWTQRFEQPEIVAVDHGSTDGSVARLQSARGRLEQFISAPQANRYEALNNAIAQATGDWILLLGGRDRLVGDMVLSETFNWMKKTEAGVVAGESASDAGDIQKLHSHVNAAAGNFAPRSATFYRRSLFAENGGFDPTLSSMGEYEFNVRLWKGRVRFKPIPLRIAACDAGVARFDWTACQEEIRVRHRYFSSTRCLGWDAVSLLRWAKGRLSPPRR